MTGAGGLRQSYYQVLFHCLEAAARFVPPAQSPTRALQSLREIIPAMPAPSAIADTDDSPPTTAQQTLELVTIAGDLPANPLGWETVSGVNRILADLTGQLGSVVRREKAPTITPTFPIGLVLIPAVVNWRSISLS